MSDRQRGAAMLVLAVFGTVTVTAMTIGLTALGVTMTLHWWGG